VLTSLSRFARHITRRRRTLAALFVLGLIGSAVSLSTPLVGMAFVDAVATRADFAAVPLIAAALVALALVDLVFAVLTGRIHARLSTDVLADLRCDLFARCVDAPLERIEPLRHGDLLTRFGTDLARIETLLVDGALGAVSNVLFLAVAAAITFDLSPMLALWSFTGVLIALGAAAAFRRTVEQRSSRVRDAMADLSHFLSERLSGLRAIRLHRAQDEDKARLAARSAQLSREVVDYHVLESLVGGVPGLALTLALAWIYVAGAGLLESGAISLGTFVAFVLYQGRLFGPANGLLALVRNFQEARVAVTRVAEVLDGEQADVHPAPSVRDARGRGAIVLDRVTFAYAGKPPIFPSVSLRIEPGERVALFGASGAGKSTLVQLLFGLREAQHGRVVVDGGSPLDGQCAAALGYAGAEPFLLHASVEENLRYGNPSARREDVERAAVLADAHAFIRALPAGYATIVGGRGLALSDGQRQRLGLARLLLHDPRIVVLDEAFSALDLDTELRIRRNLRDAFCGRTMLVISHRPVALSDFDRVLMLLDGRFVPLSKDERRSLVFGWSRDGARAATESARIAGVA
jgi:ABC-type bacteriocin/lantibiotic exporter with double-glycine peptidase domain